MKTDNRDSCKRRLLFRLEGCPYCRRAEAALDSAGISYEKVEIENNDRSVVALLSGQSTVPVLVEVVGCDGQDDEIVEYVQSGAACRQSGGKGNFMTKTIIGVMGPGEEASTADVAAAFKLGALIAESGWVTLSGGRNSGVMDAVTKGAKSAGGLTIGVLPTNNTEKISSGVDIPIITDMGSGRNNINVLSSAVVIACGMGRGTASEVSLALKAKKQTVLLGASASAKSFFSEIGAGLVHIAATPEEAVLLVKKLLKD